MWKKHRKKFLFLIFVFALIGGAFLGREYIFSSVAEYLVDEDHPEPADVIFVLSGGAFDRGKEASLIYKDKLAPKVICLGKNEDPLLELIGIKLKESEITKKVLLTNGVPENAIEIVPLGTSTREEASAILEYCQTNKINKIIIVSSEFHTKRVKFAFEKDFKANGIKLIVQGAKKEKYDCTNWWKSEDGLIAVNNEYIKLLYYHIKY